jgi:phosphate transport system substrate-binding protein
MEQAVDKRRSSTTGQPKSLQARPLLKHAALLAALLVCCSCRREGGATLNIVGSTSIQPFAELLNEEYSRQYPDRRVDVQGGGSTAGLQAVTNGLANIGMRSRFLKPYEADHFTPVTIARDGLVIVVHPSNPVTGLSLEQLRGLFAGRITNWKEVGGRDGPVRLITREEGSGTRESFVNLVMGKERISRRALTQESNGAVKELVRGDSAAVGYMSLGLVGYELRALCIDGAEPTSQNVVAGKYRLARPFLFITNGIPSPDAQSFIAFVLSDTGQHVLEAEGLVRAQ